MQGGPDSLAREPVNYFDVTVDGQWRVFAHGRDPYLDGWTDTVQIDYRTAATRRAMADILLSIAERCDGARCDMAMLVTRDIFLRTWGGAFEPPRAEFWPAVVTDLHARYPGFLLLAEVYWDLEWELQQQGFDYTYDKRLYDRLLEHDAMDARLHLTAAVDYQRHLARFIENHDERRAAEAFGVQRSLAAAASDLHPARPASVPRGPVRRLARQAAGAVGPPAGRGHGSARSRPSTAACWRPCAHPIFHDGEWQLLKPSEEWAGNPTYRNIVAHRWSLNGRASPGVRQPVARPVTGAGAGGHHDPGRQAPGGWYDVLNDTSYVRRGDEMVSTGLYIDLPGYGYHLFEVHGE